MKIYSHSSNSSLCSRASIASTTIEQLLQFEALENDRNFQLLLLEGEAATSNELIVEECLTSQTVVGTYYTNNDVITSNQSSSEWSATSKAGAPTEYTPEGSITEDIEIGRVDTPDISTSSSMDISENPKYLPFPLIDIDPSIDPDVTEIASTPNSTYCSDTFIEDPNIIETGGARRVNFRNNKRSLSDLFSPHGCSETTKSAISTINSISDIASVPPGPPGPPGPPVPPTNTTIPKKSIIYKKYLKSQCCKAAKLFPILTHDSVEVIAREIENYHSLTKSLTRDECIPPFSTFHIDEPIFWRVPTPDRSLQNSTITVPPSAGFCHMMSSTVFDNDGKEYKRYVHTIGLDIDTDGKVFHDSYAPHNHQSMLVIRQPEPDEDGGIVDPITNETLYNNFLDQYRITYKK